MAHREYIDGLRGLIDAVEDQVGVAGQGKAAHAVTQLVTYTGIDREQGAGIL